MKQVVYRFRPGALDHIARSLGIHDDRGLAAALHISTDELHSVRNGAVVGLPMAVHVASLMGSSFDLRTWTQLVSIDAG